MNQYTPLMERFEKQYIPEPNTGCWIWIGATRIGKDIRPRMRLAGGIVYAYRFAYETFVGPIDENALICHRCDFPLCVNPRHLFLGDQRSNAYDAIAKGRATFQRYPEMLAQNARLAVIARETNRRKAKD